MPARPPLSATAKKRVRIIKKVRIAGGLWKFISLDRVGNRYVWDKRSGYYFLEWWEGKKRRRQRAGETPSEAIEAQRRNGTNCLANYSPREKLIRSLKRAPRLRLQMPSPCFWSTWKRTRPTSPSPSAATDRSWDTLSSYLGKRNTWRQSLAQTTAHGR